MSILPDGKSLPLGSLLDELDAQTIAINPKYQRSGEIWPPRAKSFLVETILLGMPIPHILLHILDRPAGPHHSEIIDGQQRCTILQQFRAEKLAITTATDREDLHGKKFADLSAKEKKSFNDYEVFIDQYSGLSHKQIREVFRRLNYYTAPLNAAEQRHAQFYGELSRFVEDQAELWRPTFEELRVFTPKQARRRGAEQLLAEVVDAMLNGITTPSAATLRKTYKKHESQFLSGADFTRRLARAQEIVAARKDIQRGPLRRHYHIFALILAAVHSSSGLRSIRRDIGDQQALRPVSEIDSVIKGMERAVKTKNTRGKYGLYYRASAEKTNVRANRLIRVRYFYQALTGHVYTPAELRQQ